MFCKYHWSSTFIFSKDTQESKQNRNENWETTIKILAEVILTFFSSFTIGVGNLRDVSGICLRVRKLSNFTPQNKLWTM